MGIVSFHPEKDGGKLTIGIIQSRFNGDITCALKEACLLELDHLGVVPENIFLATVPGALEIPLMLQKMAASAQFNALIALGAVIRGETYHFNIVSNHSSEAIARIALDYDIPIVNGILTTYSIEQAEARAQECGTRVAQVAVEMGNLAEIIESEFNPYGDASFENEQDD